MARRAFSQNGTVVNISRNGVLFVTTMCRFTAPILGVHVQLEIFLGEDRQARCLYCEGRIIRIAAAVGRPLELALCVSRMDFRKPRSLAPLTITSRPGPR
jgi:hypothetical protein